jgi:hypothetical protein
MCYKERKNNRFPLTYLNAERGADEEYQHDFRRIHDKRKVLLS